MFPPGCCLLCLVSLSRIAFFARGLRSAAVALTTAVLVCLLNNCARGPPHLRFFLCFFRIGTYLSLARPLGMFAPTGFVNFGTLSNLSQTLCAKIIIQLKTLSAQSKMQVSSRLQVCCVM